MHSRLSIAAVVRLDFEPAWLGLSRDARRDFASRISAILERHPDVDMTWFDADALGSGYSDFTICRFDDLKAYHFLWEELKDTELFSRPYLRIIDVTLGIEQGYEAYEAQSAK